MNRFELLPNDLLDWFFSKYLSFRSQITCKKVCKRFKNIKIRLIPGNPHAKLTNTILKQFPFLTELYATYNLNITSEGLKYVPLLKTLNANSNPNITSEGLKYVPLLTRLYATGNSNITDEGLKYVPLLTTLYATGNNIRCI